MKTLKKDSPSVALRKWADRKDLGRNYIALENGDSIYAPFFSKDVRSVLDELEELRKFKKSVNKYE